MSFNIVRGYSSPLTAEQIRTHKLQSVIDKLKPPASIVRKKELLCNEIKQNYSISSSLKTNRFILQNCANASGDAQDFFKQCKQALDKEDMKLLPETLKKYFLPEIDHYKTIFNLDGKYKNATFNLESYYKEMQTIFNVKEADYKPEETRNNNGTLTFQDYENYCKKQKENLFNLDEEAIENKLKDIYTTRKNLKIAKNDRLLQKDVKLLKLSIAKIITKGLSTRDYSFYTVPINNDIIENIINKFPTTNSNAKVSENTLSQYYKEAVMEYQQSQFTNWGIDKKMVTDEQGNEIGSLITIPQTKKGEPNFENRYRVIQTHSCHNWCTHTKNAIYIKNGNFVIYKPGTEGIKSNKDNVAFRYVENEIVEIENAKNNRVIDKDNIKEITDILRTETGKTLIKDLSPSILDELDKVATEENIDLSDIYNTYLDQFINDDNNNISKLSPSNLKGINSIFAEKPDYTDKVKTINDAYLEQFVNNNNNDKLSELSPSGLQIINNIFIGNEDYTDRVETINGFYINQLAGNDENISRLNPFELSTMNDLYKNKLDYTDKVETINNKYLDQFANNYNDKLSELTLSDLKDINNVFKDKPDYTDKVETMNNKYLDQFVNNDNDKLSELTLSDLKNINNVFEDKPDYTDKVETMNNKYLEQFVNNDNDKLSELSSFDLQDINNMFRYKQKNTGMLKRLNHAYLEQFIKDNNKMSNLEFNNFKHINNMFRYIGEYTDQLKEFNDVYFNQHNIMEPDTIDFDEFDVPLPPPPPLTPDM